MVVQGTKPVLDDYSFVQDAILRLNKDIFGVSELTKKLTDSSWDVRVEDSVRLRQEQIFHVLEKINCVLAVFASLRIKLQSIPHTTKSVHLKFETEMSNIVNLYRTMSYNLTESSQICRDFLVKFKKV